MDIDTSGLLQNYMNSKITSLLVSKLYGSSASAAMPDSTRRPFLSRMRLDSRVALQGAQNMEDAAAMVTMAQSGITAIKDKINQMREVATEAATKNGLTAAEYKTAQDTLQGLAKDIVGIAKTTSFNGMNLLDGSAGMNSDGKIQLQAGNSSMDQVLHNVLNDGLGAGNIVGADGSLNLGGLGNLMNVSSAADAQNVLSTLDGVFDRIQGIESQYSFDIKSLKNMSLLLQNQGDIMDGVRKNHQTSQDKESSSASSALSDLMGGGIMSAVS